MFFLRFTRQFITSFAKVRTFIDAPLRTWYPRKDNKISPSSCHWYGRTPETAGALIQCLSRKCEPAEVFRNPFLSFDPVVCGKSRPDPTGRAFLFFRFVNGMQRIVAVRQHPKHLHNAIGKGGEFLTMPTPQKEEIIGDLSEMLKSSQAVIFTDYRGMTDADVKSLRKQLRDVEANFMVVKNTLFLRAAQDAAVAGDPNLTANLNGPTAASFAMKDSVATAKFFVDFIANNRGTKISLKGALLDGKFLTVDQVTALSKVPPREVLIAQILGSINAPMSGVVGTLDGVLSSFVRTIAAIVDQKQAEAA